VAEAKTAVVAVLINVLPPGWKEIATEYYTVPER
jgi:hypothetical protein